MPRYFSLDMGHAVWKQIAVILAVFFAVVAIGPYNGLAQGSESAINDKRITIQMTDKPLFDVFAHLIWKYDIAIGLEESSLDSNHDDYDFPINIPFDEVNMPMADGRKRTLSGLRSTAKGNLITLHFENARFQDVMNSIVKQMRNYDWEINDDVVNIFPVRGRNPIFMKLLNRKVSEFAVWKGAEVGTLRTLIFYLPEFKSFLEENKVNYDAELVAPWFDTRPLPQGMKFADLEFKQLLNRIAKTKRGGWILKINKHKKIEGEEIIDILI